jgi:hypothetical protein
MGGTGVWKQIVEKAFQHNGGILHGNPDVVTNAGSPDTASKVAAIGTLCWDTTNSDAYICTVAAGTWVKINA